MDGVESASRNDVVLLPYLQARSERAASAALEKLICEKAQPIIHEVIRSKLRIGHSPSSDLTDDEAADLAGEVTLKLVRCLCELSSNLTDQAIENFRGYVAVMAYHACDGYLRKKYPRRHSLKNQLRYVLTHHEGFAVWEGAGGVWLCGFARWRDGQRAARQSKLREFVERPGLSDRFAKQVGEKLHPPDLLAAIFEYTGEPVELDGLVSVVAELWHVKDQVPRSNSIEADHPADAAHAESSDQLETKIDQRAHLEKLWAEICELPLRQRVALLLGLRDAQGRGVLALLPLIQIASLRQIAAALSMPAESLASLWNQLPLEDRAIAEALGVTRQQVVNLRKCARERLRRRTRKSWGQM
ncbi:MAG: hypothetical protein ACJ74W_14550 [Pyrinomonadaceae bacterium]